MSPEPPMAGLTMATTTKQIPALNIDTVYVVGDSFVQGWGQADDLKHEVTEQNRFTRILSERLGVREINRGQAGASNEYIFRETMRGLRILGRDRARTLFVVAWTEYSRREIWFSKSKPSGLTQISTVIPNYHVDYYDDNHAKTHSWAMIQALHLALTEQRVPWLEFWTVGSIKHYQGTHSLDMDRNILDMESLLGRDRYCLQPNQYTGHPTPQGHRRIAERIIESLARV